MGLFTGLLNHLKNHFEVEEVDFENGYVRRTYSDGLDTYQVDVFEGKEHSIMTPEPVQVTRSGKQEFKK